MAPHNRFLPIVFLLAVGGVFFYKSLLFGYVPFPGDLVVSEYKPWQSYSYLGYNPGAVPNKAQYFDTARQLYPWKTHSLRELRNASVPLWNPYNFSGAPHLANFQSAFWYPINILTIVLGQLPAWTLSVILQTVLASLFTYLYCRTIGITSMGSLLSSIAFSYSMFMIVFLEYNTIGHTILWLPLALWAIESILKRISFLSIALLLVGIVSSLFAGHLQLFGIFYAFVILYGMVRVVAQNWKAGRKAYVGIVIILTALLSLGIGGLQLLPTMELLRTSARSAQPYQFLIEKLLIAPYQLVMYLVPDFFGNPATRNYLLSDTYPGKALYVGLIPVILALASLRGLRKNFFVTFYTALSVIILILITRTPFTELIYRVNLPLISSSSPTNAVFLVSFFLSVLSGFGFDQWQKFRESIRRSLFVTGIVLTLLWIAVGAFHVTGSARNLLYSTIIFASFALLVIFRQVIRKKSTVIGFLVVLITIADLFYFFHKFNPFVPKDLVFPQASILTWIENNAGIDRFWGYGTAAIAANFATQYSVFSPDGYDPLYPRRYGAFISSSNDGKILSSFSNQTRSDAVIAPGFGEFDLPGNFYRKRVLDALGVKYILDRPENGSTQNTFPPQQYKQIANLDSWIVYENLRAVPRAFLTSRYEVFRTKEEFENYFFDPTFDPARTILLEEEPPFTPRDSMGGELTLLVYEPTRVMLKAKTDGPQLLFLSDTYYPGWQASIDNSETPIYRADYAFRAVLVPSGEHTIIFRYQPASFSTGLKIAMISTALMLLLALVVVRRQP